MAFTAKDVQKLREQTGAGMMDCKKALTSADGDFEKAIEYLREKGLAAAAKKAGRIAAEGAVYAYVCPECGIGAVVEVNSETDFVAKNEEFKKFCADICNVVIKDNPADMEALAECKYPGSDLTVKGMQQEKVLTIGENIQLRRFERYDASTTNVAYIHMGGKIGVLVQAASPAGASEAVLTAAKDCALQIAAMKPSYLKREDVPATVLEEEKTVVLAQMAEDPKMKTKPQQVLAKIAEGKVGKYYSENCLLEQTFVKDGSMNVKQYVDSVAKAAGTTIDITGYVCFERGEGIEKKADNFAEEIASMIK